MNAQLAQINESRDTLGLPPISRATADSLTAAMRRSFPKDTHEGCQRLQRAQDIETEMRLEREYNAALGDTRN